jgi:hypothetical protein
MEVANIIEEAWFTRCPWSNILNLDRGAEFMGDFAKMVNMDCGIKLEHYCLNDSFQPNLPCHSGNGSSRAF